MNDSDSGALGGFLGLLTLGAAYFIGRKNGTSSAIKQLSDQQRDNEIAELKRQIEILTRKQT